MYKLYNIRGNIIHIFEGAAPCRHWFMSKIQMVKSMYIATFLFMIRKPKRSNIFARASGIWIQQQAKWFPTAGKAIIRIRHYGLLSNHNKRRLIPICRNLIGCREFLRRFRKDDKMNAVRILYKKDVTAYPRCGGPVSYEVCSGRTYRKSSA